MRGYNRIDDDRPRVLLGTAVTVEDEFGERQAVTIVEFPPRPADSRYIVATDRFAQCMLGSYLGDTFTVPILDDRGVETNSVLKYRIVQVNSVSI